MYNHAQHRVIKIKTENNGQYGRYLLGIIPLSLAGFAVAEIFLVNSISAGPVVIKLKKSSYNTDIEYINHHNFNYIQRLVAKKRAKKWN